MSHGRELSRQGGGEQRHAEDHMARADRSTVCVAILLSPEHGSNSLRTCKPLAPWQRVERCGRATHAGRLSNNQISVCMQRAKKCKVSALLPPTARASVPAAALLSPLGRGERVCTAGRACVAWCSAVAASLDAHCAEIGSTVVAKQEMLDGQTAPNGGGSCMQRHR